MDPNNTRERTIRAVLWLAIIGLLLLGGVYRRRHMSAPELALPPGQGVSAAPASFQTATGPVPTNSTANPAGTPQPRITFEPVPGANGDTGVTKVTVAVEGIMGTNSQVTFWNLDEATATAAAEVVFEVFRDVDRQFSTYKPESEISRLNATAADAPVACSPRMWELLQASRAAYRESGGSFDVTAGPLMKMWGFYRKRQALPGDAEIATNRALVGLDQVTFDDAAHTVRFAKAGMNLDFGGIAKGYALDLAGEALAARGIHCALIDLGGNLLCMPEPPPGRSTYSIGIRHPRQGGENGAVAFIQLPGGRAVSTSGDYERFVEIDGKRYSHIMDPRTGSPVRGMAAVTVVTPSGIASDYLSTTIYVNHAAGIDAIQAAHPDTEVLVITTDDHGTLDIQPHGAIWNDIVK